MGWGKESSFSKHAVFLHRSPAPEEGPHSACSCGSRALIPSAPFPTRKAHMHFVLGPFHHLPPPKPPVKLPRGGNIWKSAGIYSLPPQLPSPIQKPSLVCILPALSQSRCVLVGSCMQALYLHLYAYVFYNSWEGLCLREESGFSPIPGAMPEVSTKVGSPPRTRATEILLGSRGGSRKNAQKPLGYFGTRKRKERRPWGRC